MSLMRWLSLALLASAAALGSFLDRARAIDPPRVGNYVVLQADFHVHAFPGDGSLPPWELAREASRRGLHAIVISNHNQVRAARFLPGSMNPVHRTGFIEPGSDRSIVIPSQEVTTPNFHIVAVGISETVDWRLPGPELIRSIQAQGGVAIAAHPVRTSWKGSEDMLPLLDGAEVAHPLTIEVPARRRDLSEFYARVKAVNPTVAAIGSSDFHMVHPVGVCRTYVFAESYSVAGILDAIRASRTVAEDPDGLRHGDPALVSLLEPLKNAPVTTPDGSRVLRLLSVAMALAGILGLALLR